MSTYPLKTNDTSLHAVQSLLSDYERDHPGSSTHCYRYNPASIRIRIIDPAYHGLDKHARERLAYRYIDRLEDDVFQDVTLLLLFTPEELAAPPASLMNLEFEDPRPSRL